MCGTRGLFGTLSNISIQEIWDVGYFCKKNLSWLFDRVLNAALGIFCNGISIILVFLFVTIAERLTWSIIPNINAKSKHIFALYDIFPIKVNRHIFFVSCSQDRYSFPSKLMFGIDMPHTHTYSSLTLLSWCANGSCYFNVLMSSSNETYFINERSFYSLVLIISRLNSFEVMCQFAAIYINKCWNLCICFFMQY